RFAPPQRNPQYRLIVENLSSSCSWQVRTFVPKIHIFAACSFSYLAGLLVPLFIAPVFYKIDIVLALVVALLFLWLLDVAFGFCLPFRLMATLLKICLDYIFLYIPQKSQMVPKLFEKTTWEKRTENKGSKSGNLPPLTSMICYTHRTHLSAFRNELD
ncbi:10643_t:CDS:1, partial [Racocetra persica]